MATAARKAMARLTAVMPIELADRVEAKYLSVTPSEHTQHETIDMTAIRRAIHLEHKLLIVYTDAAGKSSERVVWPFFLSYLDGSRLISAWCELRDGIRHFRTDRMVTLSGMETRYPRRRHDLIKLWRELESREFPQK